jgi:hypothetical protein
MRNSVWFAIVIITAVVLTGCGQNASQQPTATLAAPTVPAQATLITTATPAVTQVSNAAIATSPAPKATLRIVHAALNVPDINVYNGISAIVTNLAFSQSAEPIGLDAGNYTLKITQAGASSDAPPLLEMSLALEGGESLLLALIGSTGQLKLVSFPETPTLLNGNESVVTVVQALADVQSISLRQQGKDLISPVKFGQSATSAVLPTGQTELEFRGDKGSLLNYPLELQGQQHYTLILAGSSGKPSVIKLATSAPGHVSVRVIQGAAAINNTDWYLGNKPLAQNVGYKRASERQQFISGTYTVNLYAAGADPRATQPLASQSATFEAGATIALILIGTTDKPLILIYAENLAPTPADSARLAFLNTLPTTSRITMETANGPMEGVGELEYGQLPKSILFGTGLITLYASSNGGQGEIAQNVEFKAGRTYLYLVTGQQDNNPVILSDDVGIEPKSGEVTANSTQQAPTNAARIRFINAVNGSGIFDVLLNQQPIIAGLSYAQGSPFTALTNSNASITVKSGETELLNIEQDFTTGTGYTIILYGANPNQVKASIISDGNLIFDGSSPHLRLINLSADGDALLGLYFSTGSEPPTPTPEATIDPSNAIFRRSIPLGARRLISSVKPGDTSNPVLMPVGSYNVYVTDAVHNQIAVSLYNLQLEGDVHYDVVAYQEAGGLQVRAFAVKYPG